MIRSNTAISETNPCVHPEEYRSQRTSTKNLKVERDLEAVLGDNLIGVNGADPLAACLLESQVLVFMKTSIAISRYNLCAEVRCNMQCVVYAAVIHDNHFIGKV